MKRCELMCIVATVFCTLLSSVCGAATYYVHGDDPVAHDNNPGTESRPWKTIGRATSALRAGDTAWVKSGVYREALILDRSGTATRPIQILAYPGHEGKAVINAARPVTNWRKCVSARHCEGNPNWPHIYYADLGVVVGTDPEEEFIVRQLFQDGQLLPRSRYPDRRWSYPTAIAEPQSRFKDEALLSKPRDYFAGAVCHIKTAVWQIDQIPVATSSELGITLASSPRYDMTTRFGYYITNIVGEINEEGEWAYDSTLRRLYVWPRNGNPENLEFSLRDYCIRTYAHASHYVIRGLTLRNAHEHGLWLYQADDMTIEDNTVEYAFKFGIHLQGTGGTCDNNQILDNTVRHCAFRGINVRSEASHTNVEGNFVYAIGTEEYGGDLMNGQSHGIYITGPHTRVFNNRIDRTGYTSLYVDGKTLSRDISYNYITNTSLSLSDAGGFYTAGLSDVPETDHIHHNIFEDVIGCRSMDKRYDTGGPVTIEDYSGESPGIYVDERGNNRVIEHNTVINSHMAGLYFHLAPSNVARNNTLYGNHRYQILLRGRNEDTKRVRNDELFGNVMFATAPEQKTLVVQNEYSDVNFGQSNHNYFYHPFTFRHIVASRYMARSGGTTREELTMTLGDWRALTGYDADSVDFGYLDRFGDILRGPGDISRIVYNPSLEAISVDLGSGKYYDVDGHRVHGTITLGAFESKVLVAADYEILASLGALTQSGLKVR